METKDNIQRELDGLIARVERHQREIGLSPLAFTQRYGSYVGSQRTWENRLMARAWSEFRWETWLPKLRKFTQFLDGTHNLETFESLPIVTHAEFLYERLQSQADDRRCAMLIGVQGTGKTVALRHLVKKHNYAPIFLSANETWKDSRMRIATALAQAVNAAVAGSASATFNNCLETLKSHPATLLIDEAHEGGVLLMKLVKTVINDTKARVILAVYPTAWSRLINGASEAYAEAQQLLRRTLRPVKNHWVNGIDKADLQAWSQCIGLPALPARADDLLGLIKRHGNYSLLHDAWQRAQAVADETDAAVTADLVAAQLEELCSGFRN